MRASHVNIAFLLAITGTLGCSSAARLYDRVAPPAIQAPQSSAVPEPSTAPPSGPTAANTPGGAASDPAPIAERKIPTAKQDTNSPAIATPLSGKTPAGEDRAPPAATKPPPATPASAESDQRDTEHRWADLLEQDLNNAVTQSPERRRIQFSKEVVDYPKVRHFIKYYSTTVKSQFKEVLNRSGKYMPMIARVLNEEGLPEELGYLALIESEFVVNTTSPNGAAGLWQFIAPTARKFGLRIDRWVDERRDPVKSTRAAAAYLKHLHDYYGRWFLATAAYNAGPGNLDKALRQSNAKDFWSIKNQASLSDETRDFVPKFIAISLIATDPHGYGFHEVRYVPPMDYEEVVVRGSMSLATLAELSGSAVSEIREFNPALLRDATPPYGKGYRIKLPASKAEIFASNVKKKSAGDAAGNHPILTHEVKRGETLFSIARRYGLSVRALMNFNGLTNSRLRIGQRLKILLASLGQPYPER